MPLRIAIQYGLAYAPVALLQADDRLEQDLGRQVQWVQLGNAAAIREAMLGGRLDLGFMGVPPYLIGRDQGMDWEAFTGVSRSPVALVSHNPRIRSLDDLVMAPGGFRIALPQPGSVQHILLAMGLVSAGHPANALDARLISMSHPDGAAALLAGQVGAQFTTPPFIARVLDAPDARVLLTGEQAFGGPFTFIVGVAWGERMADPDLRRRIATHIDDAAALLNPLTAVSDAGSRMSVPDASAAALARLAALYELPEAELAAQLQASGIRFGSELLGVDRFREAMTRLGYVGPPGGAGDE